MAHIVLSINCVNLSKWLQHLTIPELPWKGTWKWSMMLFLEVYIRSCKILGALYLAKVDKWTNNMRGGRLQLPLFPGSNQYVLVTMPLPNILWISVQLFSIIFLSELRVLANWSTKRLGKPSILRKGTRSQEFQLSSRELSRRFCLHSANNKHRYRTKCVWRLPSECDNERHNPRHKRREDSHIRS